MSRNFSANQYNDANSAKSLRNWQYGINNPNVHPRRRCGVTQPISDNNGHLLPHIKRDPYSSPWGDYQAWIWEKPSTKCDCVDRIRNPQDYDRPRCDILVVNERPYQFEAKLTGRELAQHLFQPPQKPQITVTINDKESQDHSTAHSNNKNFQPNFNQ